MRCTTVFPVVSLLAVPAEALAQPTVVATLPFRSTQGDAAPLLPEAVRKMLTAAIASGNPADIATVARFARQTNPEAAAEIADMVDTNAKDREAARVEMLRTARFTKLWKGRVEVGGFVASGTSDEVGISGSLRLQRNGLNWTHTVFASVDYRRANGRTSREQVIASYQPRYQFDRGFAYMLGQFERDPFNGFDGRYTGSAGLGYRILPNDPVKLSIDVGPSVRQVEFIDDTRETNVGLRSSIDFSWKITPTLTFRQTAAGYAERHVRSLMAQTSLNSRLFSRLSANISYNLQYETETRLTRERLDSLSKVSLVYDF